jgi:hypothetical protein
MQEAILLSACKNFRGKECDSPTQTVLTIAVAFPDIQGLAIFANCCHARTDAQNKTGFPAKIRQAKRSQERQWSESGFAETW